MARARGLDPLTLRSELLNGEIFNNLKEAEILIEQWRKEYNGFRPHSAMNYQPTAPSAVMPKVQRRHHLRLTQKVDQILGAGQDLKFLMAHHLKHNNLFLR